MDFDFHKSSIKIKYVNIYKQLKNNNSMVLRNTNLKFKGFDIPDNVYLIKKRTVDPLKSGTQIEFNLVCYKDDTEEYEISIHKFKLKISETVYSTLGPPLYESELLLQKGNQRVDGVLLSDFEVIVEEE